MKKGIVILLMTIVAGGMVFASGNQEESNDVDRDDFRRGGTRNIEVCPNCGEDLQPEEVTLTGTIEFSVQGAVLTSDGEEWLLMYPQWALADVEVESGDEITVTGFDVPSPRRAGEDVEEGNYLRVTSAIIDGEEYVLLDGDDGRMGRGGPRGGNSSRGRR